jgi:FtsZ-interacting cell division protein ZipA
MVGGESNSYYQMSDDRAKDYPMQPQQAYNQNGQQHYQQQDYQQQNYQQQNYQQPHQDGQNYSHPPPNYGGQNFSPRPEMNGYDNKPTFDQAFKIDKPKYNDWWAGILFLAVFAGYIVVSGISLQGYGMLNHICACSWTAGMSREDSADY